MFSRSVLPHVSAVLLVLLWTLPTLGLLVSSLRTREAIGSSGWWQALTPQEITQMQRIALTPDQRTAGQATGQLLRPQERLLAWGVKAQAPRAFAPDQTISLAPDRSLTIRADGSYLLRAQSALNEPRGPQVFLTTRSAPRLSLQNYAKVIQAEGLGRAFLNTLAVTLPATILPIFFAAAAAYALAFLRFKGRALVFSVVVALLVAPLQISLIPLLSLLNTIGLGKGYLSVWLAHTGFGLPLAIYLLRNFMLGLPLVMIETARCDGAREGQIFWRIVLPLCRPALASFAIFQFLWVWNDLLVASVFLGNQPEQQVLTVALRGLLGARGGEWELLAASAFVSLALPLLIFFTLQKHLIRGLLAGSVKGG